MEYQVCRRCVMDTTAENISFNVEGFCNFCSDFITKRIQNKIIKKDLNIFINKIKKDGLKKKYDCIIGVSGGVDSSYSLLKAVEYGLKPLAVHLDNGWDSEIAQRNISNLVKKLNVDLYTHVIDWTEYRNLQEAFFRSNVIDVELLMDNAMLAVNYKLANKYKLKYILSGTNTNTEGVLVPKNWSWFKNDVRNIKHISYKFMKQRLITFPSFSTFSYIYYESIKRIKWVLFLDYFDYVKEEAIQELMHKCDFSPYPYKHYESVFTRFYQAYILIKKFNVDKRKLHFSNLIVTNQLSRNKALQLLKMSSYPSIQEEKDDIKYFLKKMNWDEEMLHNYINKPEIPHTKYKSEVYLWRILKYIYYKVIMPLENLLKWQK